MGRTGEFSLGYDGGVWKGHDLIYVLTCLLRLPWEDVCVCVCKCLHMSVM